MSEYAESAEEISTALSHLAEKVQSPEAIDEVFDYGGVDFHDVLMTSMGNRHKALLTPFYGGIQYANKLPDRLERAQMSRREMPEAVVKLRQESDDRRIAAVTLRVLTRTPGAHMMETSWQYDLRPNRPVSSTWDVIDQIQDEAESGVPVPGRSGVVRVSDERLKKRDYWPVSEKIPPDLMASDIKREIVHGITYKIIL